MALKFNSSPVLSLALLLLLAILLFDVSAALGGGVKVGGWVAIKDVKDPKVQEIGKFAVTEHNKQAKTNLEFLSVDKGEQQVVSGMNYKLVIAAKDGGAAGSMKHFEAVVWDKPWAHFRELTSFIPA